MAPGRGALGQSPEAPTCDFHAALMTPTGTSSKKSRVFNLHCFLIATAVRDGCESSQLLLAAGSGDRRRDACWKPSEVSARGRSRSELWPAVAAYERGTRCSACRMEIAAEEPKYEFMHTASSTEACWSCPMTAPDVFHLSLAFHIGRSSIPPETLGFQDRFFMFILLPTHCFFPFPVVLSLFAKSLKGTGTSPLVLLADGTP